MKPIRNDFLRKARIRAELGPASLGPGSINYLEAFIQCKRPDRILELGSGVSTLCLAQFMFESLGPNSSHTVTSLEQDAQFATKTRRLLREHGLDEVADVVVSPLTTHFITGKEFISYRISDLPTQSLEADFLVIDGPLGPPGIRTATLPLLLSYLLPGAEFVLDDAMRDGELEIATSWAKNPDIALIGVLLIEKGLLYGRVARSAYDQTTPSISRPTRNAGNQLGDSATDSRRGCRKTSK